jgi:hypothetical protein
MYIHIWYLFDECKYYNLCHKENRLCIFTSGICSTNANITIYVIKKGKSNNGDCIVDRSMIASIDRLMIASQVHLLDILMCHII